MLLDRGKRFVEVLSDELSYRNSARLSFVSTNDSMRSVGYFETEGELLGLFSAKTKEKGVGT